MGNQNSRSLQYVVDAATQQPARNQRTYRSTQQPRASSGTSSPLGILEYDQDTDGYIPGKVLLKTKFGLDGVLYVVSDSNILAFPCDVVANSVGIKRTATENVLARGNLAAQFGRQGGQGLVSELASAQHACWSYGEIRFTQAHNLNNGGDSPKKIVHFCVPASYAGDSTYLQIVSLFERSLAITHDLGLTSIAYPLIGAGANNYPHLEVMKAVLDACSLFRQRDTPLKKVYIVISSRSNKKQIIEDSIPALRLFRPMGQGHQQIIPTVSDYSDVKQAFIQSIGRDRRIRVLNVKTLPIGTSVHLTKYTAELERVRGLRPHVTDVESYGWHGTRGDHANMISKDGFDMSKTKRHIYGKGAYFASSADLAHPYSILGAYVPNGAANSTPPQGTFTMLLCKLVTGVRQLGRATMTSPDTGFDSARNGNSTYMVIFNPGCILPLAIIEYTVDRNRR